MSKQRRPDFLYSNTRSAKHGTDRRARPQNNRSSAQGASDSTGGAEADAAATAAAYAALNSVTSPGKGSSLDPQDFIRLHAATMHATIMGKEIWETVSPLSRPHDGIVAGEIIGYRTWYVLDDYSLFSIVSNAIWQPDKVMSGEVEKVVDERTNWPEPIWGGVYSYRDSSDPNISGWLNARTGITYPRAYALRKQSIFQEIEDTPIYGNTKLEYVNIIGIASGSIRCWGEVHEHEKGYRAQFARVNGFSYADGQWVDILERLNEKWGFEQ